MEAGPCQSRQGRYDRLRTVRAGLREWCAGPEARHTIAESLVYLVPGALEDLKGPASGTVQLPIHLDWGPDKRYDVADDGSCITPYRDRSRKWAGSLTPAGCWPYGPRCGCASAAVNSG